MASLLISSPPTTITNYLFHNAKPIIIRPQPPLSRWKPRLRPLRVSVTWSPVNNLDTGGFEVNSVSKFSWRDHWYPVSLVEDLDPNIPTPFTLLNRDLVIWFDKVNNQWVVFDDKCPHRLAPLSEGRIDENGHLQCSYHGWSFDGSGSCSRIPQASLDGPEARAVQSPRACATKFPTIVSQGLLFVWPDENSLERARATKHPM